MEAATESPADRDARVCEGYLGGLSTRKLADLFGTNKTMILTILERHGIPRRLPRIPPETKKKVCLDYQAGRTFARMSADHGISEWSVWDIVSRAGLEQKAPRKFADGATKAEMIRRYREGGSLVSLARDYSVDIGAIVYHLRAHGIPVRGPQEAARLANCLPCREDAFDHPEADEAARYWIGMLMADGCVLTPEGERAISLKLKRSDEGHVRAFAEFLGSGHTISYSSRTNQDTGTVVQVAGLTISSNRLADALARHGVVPRKSLTARVTGGLEMDRDFWRGVVDGDGSVFLQDKGPVICLVGSEALVGQFRAYVRRIEPRCSGSIFFNRGVYSFRTSCSYAVPVIRALYDGCAVALPRKWATARQILDNPRPVKKSNLKHMTLEVLDGLLAEHGSMEGAAAAVGMTVRSFYHLQWRRRRSRRLEAQASRQ